jgi:hypothetical protein
MPNNFNYKDKMGQHASNKFKSSDPLRDILDNIHDQNNNNELHKQLWNIPEYRKDWHVALQNGTMKEFRKNIPNWKGCP